MMGAILTARAEEDRLKLWRILGVHASLESWQLEVLVIFSIWIVTVGARFGRLGLQKYKRKSSLGSSRCFLPGKKEGEVRERKSERLCDGCNAPIMAFSTFAFRASGLFCEDCDAMEAQDDLQRRIHFRHFVAAHQEIRIVGMRSAIPHYRISFYCRSHLTHSPTASTTKTAHCAYPIGSRKTDMNTVRNVRSAGR